MAGSLVLSVFWELSSSPCGLPYGAALASSQHGGLLISTIIPKDKKWKLLSLKTQYHFHHIQLVNIECPSRFKGKGHRPPTLNGRNIKKCDHLLVSIFLTGKIGIIFTYSIVVRVRNEACNLGNNIPTTCITINGRENSQCLLNIWIYMNR